MLLPVIDILKKKWLDTVFILVSRVHNLNRKESFVQFHAQMTTFSKCFFRGGMCVLFGVFRDTPRIFHSYGDVTITGDINY